jgi:hypothetical protein
MLANPGRRLRATWPPLTEDELRAFAKEQEHYRMRTEAQSDPRFPDASFAVMHQAYLPRLRGVQVAV